MFGESRAQESRVRRVVRARIGVLELEVGDDRHLILYRLQWAEDGRQLAEHLTALRHPARMISPHRYEHEPEPGHGPGCGLGQRGRRGNHRVEQRQRQHTLNALQERAPW